MKIPAHIYLQFLRTSRSETETLTISWWLAEVGRDREVNHCQLPKGRMKHIQNKHASKKNPGSVGSNLKTDAPCPPCHCKQSWTDYLDTDVLGPECLAVYLRTSCCLWIWDCDSERLKSVMIQHRLSSPSSEVFHWATLLQHHFLQGNLAVIMF